jgi:hypothetical protein
MAILLFVHLTGHSSTAMEQFELYFSGASTTTAVRTGRDVMTPRCSIAILAQGSMNPRFIKAAER